VSPPLFAEAGVPSAPASAGRRISTGSLGPLGEIIDRFAHCSSVEELPPELRDNALIRHLVSMPPEEQARQSTTVEAHREALARYDDDPERILAAIAAGEHPLQHAARERSAR
jgi:hypothetical protein